MSPRAPSVCAAPGCTRPAPPGQSRCTDCTAARRSATRKPDTRPSAAARGYDATWRRFRRSFLRAHPLCVVCGGIATEVDHIDGQGPLGPRGFDPSNCQAMCHADHARKTSKHDGSFGRAKRRGGAA